MTEEARSALNAATEAREAGARDWRSQADAALRMCDRVEQRMQALRNATLADHGAAAEAQAVRADALTELGCELEAMWARAGAAFGKHRFTLASALHRATWRRQRLAVHRILRGRRPIPCKDLLYRLERGSCMLAAIEAACASGVQDGAVPRRLRFAIVDVFASVRQVAVEKLAKRWREMRGYEKDKQIPLAVTLGMTSYLGVGAVVVAADNTFKHNTWPDPRVVDDGHELELELDVKAADAPGSKLVRKRRPVRVLQTLRESLARTQLLLWVMADPLRALSRRWEEVATRSGEAVDSLAVAQEALATANFEPSLASAHRRPAARAAVGEENYGTSSESEGGEWYTGEEHFAGAGEEGEEEDGDYEENEYEEEDAQEVSVGPGTPPQLQRERSGMVTEVDVELARALGAWLFRDDASHLPAGFPGAPSEAIISGRAALGGPQQLSHAEHMSRYAIWLTSEQHGFAAGPSSLAPMSLVPWHAARLCWDGSRSWLRGRWGGEAPIGIIAFGEDEGTMRAALLVGGVGLSGAKRGTASECDKIARAVGRAMAVEALGGAVEAGDGPAVEHAIRGMQGACGQCEWLLVEAQ